MSPLEDPYITKSIRSVFFGRNPVDAGHQNLSPSHRNYVTSLGFVGSNPPTSIDQEEDEVIELYDMLAQLTPMLEKLYYHYAANPNPEIGAAENPEEGGVHNQEDEAVGNHENVAVQTQEDGAMHNEEVGTVHNEEDRAMNNEAMHNQEGGDVGNQEEDGAVHNEEAVRNQEEDGAIIHNEGDKAVGNQEDEAVEDEQVEWLLDLNQFPNLQRHSKITKREKRGEFRKP